MGLASLVLTLALFGSPATAQLTENDCRMGGGLGASLLFPYFEVDLTNVNGPSTLLAIGNGTSVASLARVVFWTDWGVPTLAFDVYLPPWAVQSLSVRNLLNGQIPSSGGGADLSGFDDCGALPPVYPSPALNGNQVAQLESDHTGGLGPLLVDCGGADHGDQVARGYITVDHVTGCSGLEPTSPTVTPNNTLSGYFDAMGLASHDNRLFGDVVYIDFDGNAAQGSEAVSMRSDPSRFGGPLTHTFYGRYHSWDGRDHRVPLPNGFHQRFFNGGAFAGSGSSIVWRDTGLHPERATCGEEPSWVPLSGVIAAREENGDTVTILDANLAGLATQRVPIDDLDPPFAFGTLVFAGTEQAWMQTTLAASGLYSASFNAAAIAYICHQPHLVVRASE